VPYANGCGKQCSAQSFQQLITQSGAEAGRRLDLAIAREIG
jgi:hypothetical protein